MYNLKDLEILKTEQKKTHYTEKQIEAIRRGALKVILRREKKE